MTADEEERIRLIFREELRAALGVNQIDTEKLLNLPLKERQKVMKARLAEAKAKLKRK